MTPAQPHIRMEPMPALKLNVRAHVYPIPRCVVDAWSAHLKVLRVLFSASKEEARLTMREVCLSSQGIGPKGALALVRHAQHHCLTAADIRIIFPFFVGRAVSTAKLP